MFIIPTSFNNLAEESLETIQYGHTLHHASGDDGMIYRRDADHLITSEE